ncbi:polypeptide P5 [Wound tumor virus]|uniref:Putative mRNA-capping enzyme P5 n=1 Tax=Wound tumor virus TaxID=10987 RepID=MCE_WTV|nr:polypeptide P5 [Wound tumor virus]P12366.1 RecName: Full=Putative mRNA-capping enzyme P5; AltName: Full=Structural protein 5; AltName: Full=mRNA guanylyltransferase P5 [Wound tumor virus]AAA48499.1 polypeptide P5 [Wound tumor virus]
MAIDSYCIPNFSQTIDNRTIVNIFQSCKYRSQLSVCFLNDKSAADKFSNSMRQGSGTITFIIHAEDGEISEQLHSTFRSVSTMLLCGMQLFVFIVAPRNVISSETGKAITWAFRGSFIELRDHGRGEQALHDILEQFYRLSPLVNVPKMGMAYYGPTSFAELLSLSSKNKTSWRYVIDYSMFTRSALVGFASHMMDECSFANKQINVIGYNPPYVWAGLRHGVTTRFTEMSTPDPEGYGPIKLILPRLTGNVLLKKVKYVQHDPQKKLLCDDSVMFALSRNILYIGVYPATHLLDYNLKGWRMVAVDPKINAAWAETLKQRTSIDLVPISAKFEFNAQSTRDIVLKYFSGVPFSIIDDSWVEGTEDYEKFQELKQSYFEQLVMNGSTSKLRVSMISMKWNRTKDVKCRRLLALLPQPYGGSLRELRAYFHVNGAAEVNIKKSEVNSYMDKFTSLSISEQIGSQKFMHMLITNYGDALKLKTGRDKAIIASYSLSNAINKKERVLKFLSDAAKSETLIIFGAPNLNRVKFMIKSGIVLGSDVTISNDLITFKNASGKVWKDYGYTQSELIKSSMIEITIEQMLCISSSSYNGVGYFANSIYNDMFSWYVPEWLFEKYFSIQDIRLSPVALVKCFTTSIRNLCYVPHLTYYALRGSFVEKVLITNNVLNSSYLITGTSHSTFKVLSNFEVPSPAGVLKFKAGDDVNISGHLLSLVIAAHFVASPTLLWATHMKRMTTPVNLPKNLDKLLFFDNKIKNGMLEKWHSREEVVLAAMIVENYVAHILNGRHSIEIIQEITQVIYEKFNA